MNIKRGEKHKHSGLFFVLGRKQCLPDFKNTEQKLCKLSIDGRKINFLPLKSKRNVFTELRMKLSTLVDNRQKSILLQLSTCTIFTKFSHFYLLSETIYVLSKTATSVALMSFFSDSLSLFMLL